MAAKKRSNPPAGVVRRPRKAIDLRQQIAEAVREDVAIQRETLDALVRTRP